MVLFQHRSLELHRWDQAITAWKLVDDVVVGDEGEGGSSAAVGADCRSVQRTIAALEAACVEVCQLGAFVAVRQLREFPCDVRAADVGKSQCGFHNCNGCSWSVGCDG